MEKHGICQVDLLKVQLLFFVPGTGCDSFNGVKGCMCAVTVCVERHGIGQAKFCIGMYSLQQ